VECKSCSHVAGLTTVPAGTPKQAKAFNTPDGILKVGELVATLEYCRAQASAAAATPCNSHLKYTPTIVTGCQADNISRDDPASDVRQHGLIGGSCSSTSCAQRNNHGEVSNMPLLTCAL
jgi:hypothetical protein